MTKVELREWIKLIIADLAIELDTETEQLAVIADELDRALDDDSEELGTERLAALLQRAEAEYL